VSKTRRTDTVHVVAICTHADTLMLWFQVVQSSSPAPISVGCTSMLTNLKSCHAVRRLTTLTPCVPRRQVLRPSWRH
jgi:hypothetical protein